MLKIISFNPIGIIHSPFKEPRGAPIQPPGAVDVQGTVEVFAEYTEGLQDLAGFSHIILIYYLHLSRPYTLTVKPFMDDRTHGVFATRAPARPNSIGISMLRLVSIESNLLTVQGIDAVEGTPLLDIKPYVPKFDACPAERTGWLDGVAGRATTTRADSRFA